MQREESEEVLRDALSRLVEEQLVLLESGANERAITSQLFRYLANDSRIPDGVTVDHEYNRVGDHYVKNLRQFVDGIVVTDDEGNPKEKLAIPDILIHTRGNHENNLIAVEAKVGADNDDADKSKIWALLSEPYAYEFGVLLKIMKEDRNEWTPYWAWNPPPRQQVEYKAVFGVEAVSALNARGRERLTQQKNGR